MISELFRPVKGIRSIDWRLTQGFGDDFIVSKGPNKGKRMYKQVVGRKGGHQGLDYAGPNPGDRIPVYASHPGTARVLNEKNGFGNYVVVDGNGYSTYYAHLASTSVKSGDWVKANQQLGMMGSSGNSTAVHLHFGLKINGERVDPTPYIINWDYSPSATTTTAFTNEQYQLIKNLIDDGIRDGTEGQGMTNRIGLVIAKLYNKLKQ